MDKTDKGNLDQPFIPDDEKKVPAGTPEEKEETKVETEVKEEVETSEKPRIPYSRFENVSRARREAEAEAEMWRKRAIELEERRFQQEPQKESGDMPDWWRKIAGDGDASKAGWEAWQQGTRQFREQLTEEAERKALEAVSNQRKLEEEGYRENLKILNDHLETVAAVAGHDLTDREESAILDIVDEYMAKDEDGNYIGALLPPDKAWEIYELKNKGSKEAQRQSRDKVAEAIGTPSSGQPTSEQSEKDKSFFPSWGRWRNRRDIPHEE